MPRRACWRRWGTSAARTCWIPRCSRSPSRGCTMAKELAIQARKDRNAALIESMLLAASADGRISDVELEALIRRVIERPEFEGTRPEELNALVESSARKLASAKDLESVMKSLRERLPD